MQNTSNASSEAILDRIRRGHLARLCGLSDHLAATVAEIYFEEMRS